MIYRHFSTAVFFCLLYFSAAPAFCQDVELVWLEAEGAETTICYSLYRDNGWSPKRILAKGKEMKVTPAIASIKNKSMAIWVNVSELAQLSLTYAIGTDGNWQLPRKLHFDFQETTAPALIAFDQRFYLFFAGNYNDDDDIYMTVFDNNHWTEPEMVHPDNSVPDVLPEPRIVNGTLTVEWQHFDGEKYVSHSQAVGGREDSAGIAASHNRSFQTAIPEKLAAKQLRKDTIHILKRKFNIDLPDDFRGVGLARAYIPAEAEMPALHVNTAPD